MLNQLWNKQKNKNGWENPSWKPTRYCATRSPKSFSRGVLSSSILRLLHNMVNIIIKSKQAGSDSGLRPPQGQSRCKNIRQPSLNNIHKLAKQIIPFTSYQDTISFLSEPYRSTPVFLLKQIARTFPWRGKTESTILEQHTYTSFEIEQACSIFPNTLLMSLRSPKGGVRPGHFSSTHMKFVYFDYFWSKEVSLSFFYDFGPAEPAGRRQTRPVFPIPIWNLFIFSF